MGRTTENMQNMLPIFAIQPVWGPCCYPPLVGPYVDDIGDGCAAEMLQGDVPAPPAPTAATSQQRQQETTEPRPQPQLGGAGGGSRGMAANVTSSVRMSTIWRGVEEEEREKASGARAREASSAPDARVEAASGMVFHAHKRRGEELERDLAARATQAARASAPDASSWQPPPTQGLSLPPTEDFLREDTPSPSEEQPAPKEEEPARSSGLPPTDPAEEERPPTGPAEEERLQLSPTEGPSRKPACLKKHLGDARFHYNKRKGRQYVCDACNELIRFGSQAFPFDGCYAYWFPPGKTQQEYYDMWNRGEHDFTWICTPCQFAASDFRNLDDYRRYIGIDGVAARQQRTANFHWWGWKGQRDRSRQHG